MLQPERIRVICLFGNGFGNKQSLSIFGIFLTSQSNARLRPETPSRSCWFCSVDFKMDVVPEDGEYSETHRQSFRSRTASLNSMPQASTANLRNSRALRLQRITCVYSIPFRVFRSYLFTVCVDRILNLPRSCRPSLAGICHTLPRVWLGLKRVHSPMSIHKRAVSHLFLPPRPRHQSSLRTRADN